MPNMLKKAINRLRDIRVSVMSESAVYDRIGVQVVLTVTRGSTGYEIADEDGLVVRSRSTDFIFTAADLILSTVLALPKRGDKIIVTVDAAVSTYEVMDLGGLGHYRPADSFGTTLRVFTKLISQT